MEIREIVEKYMKPLIEKFGKKIKAVWVYGSSTRGEAKKSSDIDVMVLLDDVSGELGIATENLIWAEMQAIAGKARKDGWLLHFQSPKLLTQWWDLLRSGEPWVVTGMRDALIIYDPSGFVRPIKRLLNAGRISATRERAFELMKRIERRREKIRKIMVESITSDILLAMVESTQAVLMYMGKAPPSPSSINRQLKWLVRKGHLDEKYQLYFESFYGMVKRMDRGKIEVSMAELESYMEKARKFIAAMEKLFERLEKEKHERIIRESFEEARKSMEKVLKKFNISARNEREMVKAVKELVEKGMLSRYYLDLLEHIVSTAVKFKRREELAEKDIYDSRLYAKTLSSYAEAI